MKISDAIQRLQEEGEPDTEIFMIVIGRGCFDDSWKEIIGGDGVPEELWNTTVPHLENGLWTEDIEQVIWEHMFDISVRPHLGRKKQK